MTLRPVVPVKSMIVTRQFNRFCYLLTHRETGLTHGSSGNILFAVVVRLSWNQQIERRVVTLRSDRTKCIPLFLSLVPTTASVAAMLTKMVFALQQT